MNALNSEGNELEQLAMKAYLYGFPLVFDIEHVRRDITSGIGDYPPASFNTFSHARNLAGPDAKFVTINNDTVYSIAQIDLSAGPVLLEVPSTNDRYYVLQFVSAWTDNFAYVGTRATGSDAGRYLLVPPAWEGDLPQNTRKIESPTIISSIVGRWAVEDADDLPAVHILQDAMSLTPLNSEGDINGLPTIDTDGLDDALLFWEKYRVYSRAFDPAPRDKSLQDSFAPLGLTSAEQITEQPTEILDVLRSAHAKASARMEESLRNNKANVIDGWQYAFHAFDFNLDYFEIGTIDSEEWKLTDPMARLSHRSASALGGLWGNHGYEACYLPTYVDSNGDPLHGSNSYALKLSPTPPNHAFWSLTMYDMPNYYLVDNPINRYSIGDRTPDLAYDEDGGITIHISANQPEDENARANWLPAPDGLFRPLIRVYIPGDALLDGSYAVPPIEKVN